MTKGANTRENQVRWAVGWGIGLFTFVVYNLTRAPTLSFWDCGEFIACANILGIPHPPGTPLYVLLGRVFTMLPTSSDIAARVNLISTITSAGAAMMAFFVLFRILKGALGENGETSWKTPVCFIGGITGSLFMSFSNTHWNNAVETEVYGPSMFIIMAVLWMVLRWVDNRQTAKGDRYLIGIVYLGFASIGIHLTPFLVIPPVFLFILLADKKLRTDWRFWLTGIVLLSIAGSFELFGVCWLIWTAAAIVGVITAKRKKAWVLILLLLGAGAIGYTNHLYIPIRSAQDPNIDENNPETFKSFRYYLGRKQYGSQNMVTRMFNRRGNPANQFGDHGRMGFWRFFKNQYGFNGWWFTPFFALGIFGCLWLWARHKTFAVLMVVLLLAGSVGLVLYMNFADGARFNPATGDAYIEVRDRDYFFTPGFIFFGLMIGVGLAGLLELIYRKRPKRVSRGAAWAGLLLVLLPLYQLQANYVSCDRSKDFVPWDYAYNILSFCEPNAILFTSGDNDTFPLWCLQETYGVRTDVSVVNLSLANTDWYNIQMRDKYHLLDTTITNEQIEWSEPITMVDRAGNPQTLYKPAEKYLDPITHTYEFLFPRPDPATGNMLRVQDMMMELILHHNRWRRPVYISGSPAGKSRWPLEKHAIQTGILYKIVQEEANLTFDPDFNAALFGDSCRYRGFDDLSIFRNESTTGNLMIYPEKFLQIADAYRRRGDTTLAFTWTHKAADLFPQYWRGYLVTADYYLADGDSVNADSMITLGQERIAQALTVNPDNRYYHLSAGEIAERQGNNEVARFHYERAFYLNPTDALTFQPLLIFAQRNEMHEMGVQAARKWLEYFPTDDLARQIVGLGRVR